MNIQKMMQQAQAAQQKLDKALKEFEIKEFDFEALSGAIKLKITGANKVVSLTIDDELVDKSSKDILQDGLIVALNQALTKINADKDAIIEAVQKSIRM